MYACHMPPIRDTNDVPESLVPEILVCGCTMHVYFYCNFLSYFAIYYVNVCTNVICCACPLRPRFPPIILPRMLTSRYVYIGATCHRYLKLAYHHRHLYCKLYWLINFITDSHKKRKKCIISFYVLFPSYHSVSQCPSFTFTISRINLP